MEYQKITNLLDNVSNQPSKFKTKNRVEITDSVRGAYSPNKQIKFKTTDLVYVIIVMRIYSLKEIYQLIMLLLMVL